MNLAKSSPRYGSSSRILQVGKTGVACGSEIFFSQSLDFFKQFSFDKTVRGCFFSEFSKAKD